MLLFSIAFLTQPTEIRVLILNFKLEVFINDTMFNHFTA